ncbi:oxidoreductase [Flavobacterium cyanobacteriorum]|uniref:Oxidoreductase n=1 Tax=Flavobacterium cyanobacteriorum TaxID=2022802 RepID=A0A255Z632_9FLAO|nr:oxidoreductase [Flavobacterium cyanobacteriorum]OYQ36090.1 oxidoreductase [Flavobacterium cyanobacteriorum]
MKKIFLLLPLALLASCKQNTAYTASVTRVICDTLLADDISIRALVIDGDKVWYAGSRGKYGYVSLSGQKAFSGIMAQDTLFPEFRAIAKTKHHILILNAGTPALLYKITKDGSRNKVVYTETGEKVFYDSMLFLDDKEGIAMGDPVEGCLSVIKTTDGGESWAKLPCTSLPATDSGEAAFAASNTNIDIAGNTIWMVSGGKKSRVFVSKDKGESWQAYNTPIIQGTESTGIYSVDFYDAKTGYAVGGDYTRTKEGRATKISTRDGGRTWKAVAEDAGFGYASCVRYRPGSLGRELISAGPSGIYYSFDGGATWKRIYNDTSLHTVLFTDSKTVVAAGNGKILRLRLVTL